MLGLDVCSYNSIATICPGSGGRLLPGLRRLFIRASDGRERMLEGELDQLRELLVVLLQQPERAQGLDAVGGLGGVGELAGGEGVLVDSDGRVGGLGCCRGSPSVVVRLLVPGN